MSNPTAKRNKLQNDIRDKVDKWTVDDYQIDNPFQMTKLEILNLIDDLTERIQ
jgi:hypothetical protein